MSNAPASESYDQAREWLSKMFSGHGEEQSYRALEIADSIVDAKRWQSATESAAKVLMKDNPEIVRPWVEKSGLSDAAKMRILAEDPDLSEDPPGGSGPLS